MSFQAYIDNIKAKTGKTPDDFKKLAEKKGLLKPGVKAMEVVNWLKKDFGLVATAMQWLFMRYLKELNNPERENMNSESIVIEHSFNVSVHKLWKALTTRDEMAKWYFDLKEFKPEVGFEFSFKGGPPDKVYVHLCKITEVIFCKKITYSWRYEGYESISYVTFELFTGGGTTRLKLTHTGLETFPQDNPDLAMHNFVAGWTDIIGRSLKEYLEK